MLRQKRFGLFQQLRAGEDVKEVSRMQQVSLRFDLTLMLPGFERRTTISQGWPSGWLDVCLVNNILPIRAGLLQDSSVPSVGVMLRVLGKSGGERAARLCWLGQLEMAGPLIGVHRIRGRFF